MSWGKFSSSSLRHRWSELATVGLETQPLALSALGPTGRRVPWNPPWQGRHHHQLDFCPKAHRGNRASAPNT
jgi:hypothetical protein